MSDTYTAALIGGPEAGKVYAVQDARPIHVMEPVEPWYENPLVDPSLPIETRTVFYERRTLGFFGKPMYVWCAPEFMGDTNRNEFVAQLAAHILSPLGITLLKEGQR